MPENDNKKIISVRVTNDKNKKKKEEGGFQVGGIELQTMDGDSLEDHLFFDSEGKKLEKNKTITPDDVERFKKQCNDFHKDGNNKSKNSFSNDGIISPIIDSMKNSMEELKKTTITGAVACASKCSDDSKQKIIDCVIFGKPSIRLKLTIVDDEGNTGILYYYPYDKRLTKLDGDREIGANINDYPNISIPDPVYSKPIENTKDVNKPINNNVNKIPGKATPVNFSSKLKESRRSNNNETNQINSL